MAFIPVANCARLELIFLLDGQYVENVLHYAGDFDPPEQMLQDMVNSADDNWSTYGRQAFNNDLSLVMIKATDQSAVDAPVVYKSDITDPVGLLTGDALPNNCAALVSFKTAGRGRNARGRMYLPGIDDTAVVGNTIQAASVSLINAYVDGLLFLTTTTGPVGLVIVSRYLNNAPRAAGVTYPVTDYIVRPYVVSQRRRLPGRGT